MRKRLLKFRRDHWRDQVITVGERLRTLERERRVTGSDYLDAEIENLVRRRKALLDKLRETA